MPERCVTGHAPEEYYLMTLIVHAKTHGLTTVH